MATKKTTKTTIKKPLAKQRTRLTKILREVNASAEAARFTLTKPTLTFEPFKDAAGEWRWRMRHRNGNIQAMSSESYKRRATMLRVLARQINVLTARNYIIGPTVS